MRISRENSPMDWATTMMESYPNMSVSGNTIENTTMSIVDIIRRPAPSIGEIFLWVRAYPANTYTG